MSKRIAGIFFLMLAIGIIAANIFVHRSRLDQETKVIMDVAAAVVMALILLIWILTYLVTISTRKKFALSLEYPSEVLSDTKSEMTILLK